MKWTSQTMVGAFVLGGVALAVAAVVLFGKIDLFHPPKQVAVVFEGSVSGLTVGAPVTFRGVHVGAVKKIKLKYDSDSGVAYIPVTLEVSEDLIEISGGHAAGKASLDEAISRGLRAELNTQSFVTGQSEIDLELDPKTAAVLHPGIVDLPEIPVRRSPLQRVKDQLSDLPLRELADNANATLKNLSGLSNRLEKVLPRLIDRFGQTSDNATEAVQTATAVLKDVQGRLDTMLSSINQLALNGDRQLSQHGAELHTLMASTNQTVLQAHEIVSDLKGLTSDRGATRATLESALRDVAAATAALRGFATDIEHNPQLLLSGRKP